MAPGVRSLAVPWPTGPWDVTPSVSNLPGFHLAPQSLVSASSPQLVICLQGHVGPLPLVYHLLPSLPLCLGCEDLRGRDYTTDHELPVCAAVDIILRNNFAPSLR